MSLPRYPEYKPSGVEWLGEVPGHWEVLPCRAFVDEQTAKNDDGKNEDYLSLMANVGIIPYAEKGDVGNKKPEDLTKCKLVSKGDFVINSMNYGIGSYALSALDGICSPVYIVLRPRLERIESRYAFRIFENRAFQTFAQSFGNGILEHRAAINWGILKGIGVGIPPKEEQIAILNFLDRETGKIDALIAEQRRLVELLAEKRQAVISHAVTKGLNPFRHSGESRNPAKTNWAPAFAGATDGVRMKDSGIAWLGEVPEHWRCTPLKYLVQLRSGGTPSKERREYWEGSIPWASSKDMKVEIISDTEDHITKLAIEEGVAKLVEKGTVLIVVRGMILARIFPVALTSERMAINQDLKAVIAGSELQPTFLAWYLRGTAHESLRRLDEAAHGTKALRMEAWTSMEIALPPLDEQSVIADFLDLITKQLESLTAEANRAISLLQERRSALISAAVTGKIDVRRHTGAGRYPVDERIPA